MSTVSVPNQLNKNFFVVASCILNSQYFLRSVPDGSPRLCFNLQILIHPIELSYFHSRIKFGVVRGNQYTIYAFFCILIIVLSLIPLLYIKFTTGVPYLIRKAELTISVQKFWVFQIFNQQNSSPYVMRLPFSALKTTANE